MLGSRSTLLYFSTVLGLQDTIHDPQRTALQQRATPANWVLISCTARYLPSVPARLRHESIATIVYRMRPENSSLRTAAGALPRISGITRVCWSSGDWTMVNNVLSERNFLCEFVIGSDRYFSVWIPRSLTQDCSKRLSMG